LPIYYAFSALFICSAVTETLYSTNSQQSHHFLYKTTLDTASRNYTNPKVVNEVYAIYIKWYNENKKPDFKSIILPLKGSPYCWLGEDKGMEPFLKKSL